MMAAILTYATTELLETVLSVRSMQRPYLENQNTGEEETQCLGVQMSHPIPKGNKYQDLALQDRRVSNQRQLYIAMSYSFCDKFQMS
jgi:hypothetical protein